MATAIMTEDSNTVGVCLHIKVTSPKFIMLIAEFQSFKFIEHNAATSMKLYEYKSKSYKKVIHYYIPGEVF